MNRDRRDRSNAAIWRVCRSCKKEFHGRLDQCEGCRDKQAASMEAYFKPIGGGGDRRR